MVSSISNKDDNMQQMMALMLQKMSAADTDGTTGLSKSELSSIDSSDDAGGSAFLQALSSQFDALDADGNGELSSDEISKAAPPTGGPAGAPPAGGGSGSTSSTSSTSTTSTTSSTSSTSIDDIIEKMLKAYVDQFANQSSSTSATSTTDATQAASSITSSADKDGSGTLSLDELSSLSSTEDSKEAGWVNDLEKNFDSYDTNGDGELSQSEIAATFKGGSSAVSANEHSAVASLDSDDSSSTLGSFASLSNTFFNKLLESYKDGGLSSVASSIGIAS